MKRAALCAMVFVFLQGCSGRHEEKTLAAIHRFQEQFNQRDYESIMNQADEGLWSLSSKSNVMHFIKVVRVKLGPVVESSTSAQKYERFKGHKTMAVLRATTFEKGSGDEIFTFRLTDQGPRLFGYNIKSEELIKQP